MAYKDKGKWRVRWTENGKRYSKTFPGGVPKRAVDEYERKVRLGLISESLIAECPRFDDYADHWFEVYPTIKRRTASTQVKDRQMVEGHLKKVFGDCLLSEITAADFLEFQSILYQNGRGMSAQSVNNIRSCMSNILKLAVLERKIPYNPIASVPGVPREDRKPTFWSFAEADRFLLHCKDHDWEIFQLAAFCLNTGLRPGEVQALLRDSIDFERKFVHVRRNYCTKTNQIVNHTKNRIERRISLSDSVLAAISNKRRLASTDRVFPLQFNTIGKRRLEPLMKAAGVPVIRFHDFRHTFASHLVMRGKNAVEVKELLGHKKLSSTDIYMHLTEEHKIGATDCLTQGMSWIDTTAAKVIAIG